MSTEPSVRNSSVLTSDLFEAPQRRALHKMQFLATALLLVMIVLYVIAHILRPTTPALGWLEAFTEAAMVGALADWFAVTALFRHPLGVPIPHTAIIPSNKDRVANTMGHFVQSNFLSADVVVEKIAQLNVAGRISLWLHDPLTRGTLARRLTEIIPDIISTLNDAAVQNFLHKTIAEVLRAIPLSKSAGKLLEGIVKNDSDGKLFNHLLLLLEDMVERHHLWIRETLRNEMPWYVPGFIHDRVYENLVARFRQTVSEVNRDPSHRLRAQVLELLQRVINDLKESPEYAARFDHLREWLLTTPQVLEYINRLWISLKELLGNDTARPDGVTARAMETVLAVVSEGLVKDLRTQEKLNELLERALRLAFSHYQNEIIALVSDTIKNWDSSTLINKIELQVGRDLQYIRINGTLVGGSAGLLIYALTQLL